MIFLDKNFALYTSRMALTELFSTEPISKTRLTEVDIKWWFHCISRFFSIPISGFGILSHQSTKIRKFFLAFIISEVHKPTFRTDYRTLMLNFFRKELKNGVKFFGNSFSENWTVLQVICGWLFKHLTRKSD